jgi:hypothetical protein
MIENDVEKIIIQIIKEVSMSLEMLNLYRIDNYPLYLPHDFEKSKINNCHILNASFSAASLQKRIPKDAKRN